MLDRARRTLRIHIGVTVTVVALVVGGVVVPAGVSEASAAPTAAPVAQRGDRSLTVAWAQQLLLAAGVPVPGGVDGVYGSGTAGAVSEYQRRRGLPISGVIDVATATALGMLPPTAVLAKGATGPAVTQVQQQLLAVGVAVRGGADGVYGSGTAAAVQAFQTSKGLGATGSVDAATAAILATAASGAAPAAAPSAPAAAFPQPGSRGAAVVAFQQQLIAVGARPNGGADGVYGPATVSALKLFQKWMGLPSNGVLDAATATSLAAAASKVGNSAGVRLAAFPVNATCKFWDTFGAARSGGRKHEGVDILATSGTPIYAVQAGRITKRQVDYRGSLAGNAIWLTAPDGTYFFYAHLSAFANGVGAGSPVRAGDVIGYVGETGNASIPHLHFEVHPGGGGPVNPYPIVKAASGC